MEYDSLAFSLPVIIFIFFSSALLHSFLPIIAGFNTYRIFQLLVIALSFLCFFKFYRKTFFFLSMLPLVCGWVLSINGYSAVFIFFDLGYWLSVFLVSFYLYVERYEAAVLAKCLLVSSSLACVLYLPTIIMGLGFWYAQGKGVMTDFLPFGFYGIRPWSHLATWLMPLSVAAIYFCENLPVVRVALIRKILFLALSFWFLVIFGSGARGTLVAQLLGLFLVFAFVGKRFFQIFRVWGLALISGAALWLFLVLVIPSFFFQYTSDYSLMRSGASGRFELWSKAFDLSMKNFPFGAGSLSFTREVSASMPATPHSMYLRWAAEYGWLFVLMFFSFVGWLVRPLLLNMRNMASRPSDIYVPVLAWSCVSALIHASVSGVFSSPYSLLVGFPILTVLGISIHKYRFSMSCAKRRIGLLSAVSALSFGGAIHMSVPMTKWHYESVADQIVFVEKTGQGFAPRFWLHGHYLGQEDIEE